MLSGGLYASCFFFFVLVILDFGFVWDLEFGIWDFSDNIRVIWLVLFIIGYALPRDMGKLRFKVGPSSAVILEIYKLPSSSLKSFTAEATALLSNFNTGCAARFTVKSKSARASATSLLRTTSISCLVFRGAILILFNWTLISINLLLAICYSLRATSPPAWHQLSWRFPFAGNPLQSRAAFFRRACRIWWWPRIPPGCGPPSLRQHIPAQIPCRYARQTCTPPFPGKWLNAAPRF